ncbi:hypothetical protein HYZ99_01960 [Candidatus Peregrinibacteria bacterium]|nr:hypothetical protein [Candidatus Peregrinibacteria bacterium]
MLIGTEPISDFGTLKEAQRDCEKQQGVEWLEKWVGRGSIAVSAVGSFALGHFEIQNGIDPGRAVAAQAVMWGFPALLRYELNSEREDVLERIAHIRKRIGDFVLRRTGAFERHQISEMGINVSDAVSAVLTPETKEHKHSVLQKILKISVEAGHQLGAALSAML